MRVLVVTKLFPNSCEPAFAPFNFHQFSALGKLCSVQVLATIPWFPGAFAFGRWSESAKRSRVPREEQRGGLHVKHPRVMYVPKIGHAVAGPLYAASLFPELLKLGLLQRRSCEVDVVLASFAYPDGWAGVTLGRLLGVPVVIKVHGTDINVLSSYASVSRNLRWALSSADRVVATTTTLAHSAIAAGAREERTSVVGNGLDTSLFYPQDQRSARVKLGLPEDKTLLLYVGTLKRPKGILDLLEAFSRLSPRHPELHLLVVGDGEALGECSSFTSNNKLPVTFAGARSHKDIPLWMAACNLLVLPSWAEGMPNVVMEALASGRRVVATSVGGIPQVVNRPLLGATVAPRRVDLLVQTLEEELQKDYDPEQVARQVSFGTWSESARNLHKVLQEAASHG